MNWIDAVAAVFLAQVFLAKDENPKQPKAQEEPLPEELTTLKPLTFNRQGKATK